MVKSTNLWNNKKSVAKELAKFLFSGKLLLVIGAGASYDVGVPLWDGLLSKLYSGVGMRRDKKSSFGDQAELLRESRHYKGNEKKFRNDIQTILYKNVKVDFKDLNKSNLLQAIGAIVMSSTRGSSSKIINFNFDNILELYLGYYGFTLNSTADERHWDFNSDVQILHTHGFIPSTKGKHFNKHDLIFDTEDFISRISDNLHPWNQKMNVLMSNHFCLFIGLSGKDMALTKLLMNAKKNHAIRRSFWGVSIHDSSDRNLKLKWEKHGVKVLKMGYKELPDFLFGVCQEAALKAKI